MAGQNRRNEEEGQEGQEGRKEDGWESGPLDGPLRPFRDRGTRENEGERRQRRQPAALGVDGVNAPARGGFGRPRPR